MSYAPDQVWEALAAWLPDVVVSPGAVPESLPEPTAQGVLWQVAPDRFLLRVPRVARYLVEAGRRVTVEPLCDDAARVIRFLRMTPLAALLHQRGRLALHAAAAACEAGAVVLVGVSGSGKSTLLAGLLRAGWRLLADDLVVVDDLARPVVVCPTFGAVTLWPDAAKALNLADHGVGRHELDCRANLAREARPLRAIVRLGEPAHETVALRVVPGTEAFRLLSLLAYNNHVAEAILGPMPALLATARLANSAPMLALGRPRTGWCVDELVAQVAAVVSHD